MPLAVELIGISKSFANVQAIKDVRMTVEEGKIHALIGENGAGKSTLMNVLFGILRPDEGSIRLFEKEVSISSPRHAIHLGLGMVHQHFKLVPSLTVAENVFLGREKVHRGIIDKNAEVEAVRELSTRFGLQVEPNAKVSDLSVGVQQRVEILKALQGGARVLILDEPTAVLTPHETTELFENLRGFVDKGMTIIFITHRLQEVIEIADNATVLRQGKVVATRPIADTTKSELAALMVGREFTDTKNIEQRNPGKIVLDVKDLWCRNDLGVHALRGVSFQVHEGEIVGIAGVAGNGQTELAGVLAGLRKASFGDVKINGTSIVNLNPSQIRMLGMAHVPGDRIVYGVDKENTIARNLLMGRQHIEPWSVKGWIQETYLKNATTQMVDEFDIRASSIDTKVSTLSGGNIQKVVLAREFTQDADFLLIDQPTRGIDIGSSQLVHEEILRKRNAGKAVLLISVQLDEIMSLSDRVLVLFNGQIVGEIDPRTTTEEEVGLLMAGVRDESADERGNTA